MIRRSLRPLWRATLFAALVACAPRLSANGWISFEPGPWQSKAALTSAWQALPDAKRKAIERHLGRMGLSSTGTIQLLGVYRDEGTGPVLHFQQVDLFGSRLLWIVLVDTTRLSARTIYHVHPEQASAGWSPIEP